MLPLLAEWLNSVSAESSILLVAFPDGERRHSGAARYVQQRGDVQRKNITAAVEISGVGRGRTGIKTKRADRFLALIGWPRRRLRFSFPRHGRPANLRQLTSPGGGLPRCRHTGSDHIIAAAADSAVIQLQLQTTEQLKLVRVLQHVPAAVCISA